MLAEELGDDEPRPDPHEERCAFCGDGDYLVFGECPECGAVYDGRRAT